MTNDIEDHPYPRERTWSDCEAELQQLRDELAREKQEHDRATTFYAIAVKERNYERVLALKRDAEIERLRQAEATAEIIFETNKQQRAEIEQLREALREGVEMFSDTPWGGVFWLARARKLLGDQDE